MTETETETETTTDLILYERTGEVVSREDLPALLKLGAEIDQVVFNEKRIRSAVSDAIVDYWEQHGGPKTIHVDGVTATIGATEDVTYDETLLMEGLRAAGMPEADIALHVTETVVYKIDANRVKQTAKSKRYAAAIEAARSTRPKNPTVGLKVG